MHRHGARLLGALALASGLLGSFAPLHATQTQPTAPLVPSSMLASPPLRAANASLPLRFESNHGQSDPHVRFLSHGAGYTLFLTPTEAVLALAGQAAHGAVVRLRLLGSHAGAAISGLDRLSGNSNYLLDDDPRRWQTNVPAYGRVLYRQVYRGIDLLYHGSQGRLEYDFRLAPGAKPRAIRLALAGVSALGIDGAGNLVLHTPAGLVRQSKPVVYQQIGGHRRAVAGRYVLRGASEVGFAIGRHDARRPLVIDPVLGYSTLLGGTGDDLGQAIAVDAAGNTYIAGVTASNNFPLHSAAQVRNGSGAGNEDAFVAKLSAGGRTLLYSTYLGGSDQDAGSGIAVDGVGNAYVSGYTDSTNFPVSHAVQVRSGGGSDAFVAMLNPAGNALVYSTYLGGNQDDEGNAIAVDSAGDAYITGATDSISGTFPLRNAVQSSCVGCALHAQTGDAFVTKLSARGAVLLYSTYLGGRGDDRGNGIAVDATHNIFVTGTTMSPDFPATTLLQGSAGGASDAFVARLNARGNKLVYSDLLGGNDQDEGLAIAVDGARNAYVTGDTSSTNFPTTPGAVHSAYGGGIRDAFAAKINASGTALAYSTLLGGGDDDVGLAIAVDKAGAAYVAGRTDSDNFPTTPSALQRAYSGGGHDGFLARLNASGRALLYGTLLGGGDDDVATGVAVDGAGNAYLTGYTASTNYPTSPDALQSAIRGGDHDVFVTKISNAPAPLVGGMLPNLAPPSTARGAVLVAETNHSVAIPFVRAYRAMDPLLLGHPVTEAYLLDGVLTQDFDHAQLQWRDGAVVIGDLGSEVFNAQRAYDATLAAAARGVPARPDSATSRYFPRKRHLVTGAILRFWQTHGGLATFGEPISEQVRETNGDGSGRSYVMQWFQKARIELHPENHNPRYAVLLGLLGEQALRERGWAA